MMENLQGDRQVGVDPSTAAPELRTGDGKPPAPESLRLVLSRAWRFELPGLVGVVGVVLLLGWPQIR